MRNWCCFNSVAQALLACNFSEDRLILTREPVVDPTTLEEVVLLEWQYILARIATGIYSVVSPEFAYSSSLKLANLEIGEQHDAEVWNQVHLISLLGSVGISNKGLGFARRLSFRF